MEKEAELAHCCLRLNGISTLFMRNNILVSNR